MVSTSPTEASTSQRDKPENANTAAGSSGNKKLAKKRIRIEVTDSEEEGEEESKRDVDNLVCNICLCSLNKTYLKHPTNVKKHWLEFPCCSLKIHGTCLVHYYLDNQKNITGSSCPVCRKMLRVFPSYVLDSFSQNYFPRCLLIYLPVSIFIHHWKTKVLRETTTYELAIKELLKKLEKLSW